MRENSEGKENWKGYDDGDDPITLPGNHNVPKSVVIVLILLIVAAVGGLFVYRVSNGNEPTIECPAPGTVSETLECLERNPRAVPSPSPLALKF